MKRTAATHWLPMCGLVVALTACATTPPRLLVTAPVDLAAFEQTRQQTLAASHNWTLTGRIAVHNEHENWSATLHWVQQADTYTLNLIGPLGQGAVQITGGRGSVLMRLADGQSYTANDAETLLRERAGWSVPVTGLRYWVRGLPDPRTTAQQGLDEAGRPLFFEQSGWRIEYARYARVNGIDLPHKLTLMCMDARMPQAHGCAGAANNSNLQMRLVIDRWDLG